MVYNLISLIPYLQRPESKQSYVGDDVGVCVCVGGGCQGLHPLTLIPDNPYHKLSDVICYC